MGWLFLWIDGGLEEAAMIPDSWGAARGREPGFPPLSRQSGDTVETVINRSNSGNCWTKK
ncbi:hypothetical protein BN2364_0896 [Alloalcanivorax xenomutans]|nr:hypothetical protein BN2364_0896 [Alloalcanivorax xenomutans]